MSPYYSNEFIVNSCELPCKGIYCKTVYINKDLSTIVAGVLFNSNRTPAVGAVIEVTEFNPSNNTRVSLGYSFTDSFGRYAFYININPCAIYEFTVYSPLSTKG